MRTHAIAGAAIWLVAGAGCSGELALRPAAHDPSNVAAVEAPFTPPSPPPEPATTRAKAPTRKTVYVCPMHPEVRSPAPGTCPKCGMTLVAHDDAGDMR